VTENPVLIETPGDRASDAREIALLTEQRGRASEPVIDNDEHQHGTLVTATRDRIQRHPCRPVHPSRAMIGSHGRGQRSPSITTSTSSSTPSGGFDRSATTTVTAGVVPSAVRTRRFKRVVLSSTDATRVRSPGLIRFQ
jgi:hypothetical protein